MQVVGQSELLQQWSRLETDAEKGLHSFPFERKLTKLNLKALRWSTETNSSLIFLSKVKMGPMGKDEGCIFVRSHGMAWLLTCC